MKRSRIAAVGVAAVLMFACSPQPSQTVVNVSNGSSDGGTTAVAAAAPLDYSGNWEDFKILFSDGYIQDLGKWTASSGPFTFGVDGNAGATYVIVSGIISPDGGVTATLNSFYNGVTQNPCAITWSCQSTTFCSGQFSPTTFPAATSCNGGKDPNGVATSIAAITMDR